MLINLSVKESKALSSLRWDKSHRRTEYVVIAIYTLVTVAVGVISTKVAYYIGLALDVVITISPIYLLWLVYRAKKKAECNAAILVRGMVEVSEREARAIERWRWQSNHKFVMALVVLVLGAVATAPIMFIHGIIGGVVSVLGFSFIAAAYQYFTGATHRETIRR